MMKDRLLSSLEDARLALSDCGDIVQEQEWHDIGTQELIEGLHLSVEGAYRVISELAPVR